jgi:hypothetical protein
VDEAGKILRFIAIKQDVTEQRIAREQLEKQNDYLSDPSDHIGLKSPQPC